MQRVLEAFAISLVGLGYILNFSEISILGALALVGEYILHLQKQRSRIRRFDSLNKNLLRKKIMKFENRECKFPSTREDIYENIKGLNRQLYLNRVFIVDRWLQEMGPKVLDAGCGQGVCIKGNEENIGFGIDISRSALHDMRCLTRRKVEAVCGDIEFLPFRSATFNGIIAGESLEHLISPINFLKEANRVLKTHGSLVITTENAYQLPSYTLNPIWLLGEVTGFTHYISGPRILQRHPSGFYYVHRNFTLKKLISLIRKARFVAKKWEYVSMQIPLLDLLPKTKVLASILEKCTTLYGIRRAAGHIAILAEKTS